MAGQIVQAPHGAASVPTYDGVVQAQGSVSPFQYQNLAAQVRAPDVGAYVSEAEKAYESYRTRADQVVLDGYYNKFDLGLQRQRIGDTQGSFESGLGFMRLKGDAAIKPVDGLGLPDRAVNSARQLAESVGQDIPDHLRQKFRDYTEKRVATQYAYAAQHIAGQMDAQATDNFKARLNTAAALAAGDATGATAQKSTDDALGVISMPAFNTYADYQGWTDDVRKDKVRGVYDTVIGARLGAIINQSEKNPSAWIQARGLFDTYASRMSSGACLKWQDIINRRSIYAQNGEIVGKFDISGSFTAGDVSKSSEAALNASLEAAAKAREATNPRTSQAAMTEVAKKRVASGQVVLNPNVAMDDPSHPATAALNERESAFMQTKNGQQLIGTFRNNQRPANKGDWAYGKWQVTENTARAKCKQLGIEFDLNRLANDVQYNELIGRAVWKDCIRTAKGDPDMAYGYYAAWPLMVKAVDAAKKNGTDWWTELVKQNPGKDTPQNIMDYHNTRLAYEATSGAVTASKRGKAGVVGAGGYAPTAAEIQAAPGLNENGEVGLAVGSHEWFVHVSTQQPLTRERAEKHVDQYGIQDPARREQLIGQCLAKGREQLNDRATKMKNIFDQLCDTLWENPKAQLDPGLVGQLDRESQQRLYKYQYKRQVGAGMFAGNPLAVAKIKADPARLNAMTEVQFRGFCVSAGLNQKEISDLAVMRATAQGKADAAQRTAGQVRMATLNSVPLPEFQTVGIGKIEELLNKGAVIGYHGLNDVQKASMRLSALNALNWRQQELNDSKYYTGKDQLMIRDLKAMFSLSSAVVGNKPLYKWTYTDLMNDSHNDARGFVDLVTRAYASRIANNTTVELTDADRQRVMFELMTDQHFPDVLHQKKKDGVDKDGCPIFEEPGISQDVMSEVYRWAKKRDEDAGRPFLPTQGRLLSLYLIKLMTDRKAPSGYDAPSTSYYDKGGY